jgi:2-keto-3-deoxy-L-rhamnonate aldolase RhmA
MMQFSPTRHLKEKLRKGETTFGFWVSLESPSITEIMCRMGLDWLVIDAEHNHLDFKQVMEHLRVANLLNIPCFVHISEIEAPLITRMLDLGADGILLPQFRSAEDVERGIRYAKYPPQGTRGMAAERATRWGKRMADYARRANDEIMVIPMMETVEAAENLEDILKVPGIDAVLFGPADFSSSAGFPGEWEGPGVAQRLLEIHERIRARGIPSVVLARNSQDALRRQAEKFQMIGLGSDTGTLIASMTETLRLVGAPVAPDAWK